MKQKILMWSVLLLLFVAGCGEFNRQVVDPNSGLNQAVTTVEHVAPVVGAGAAASGLPIGWIVASVAGALSSLIAVYKNHQKKLIIDKDIDYENGLNEDLANIEITTSSIVDAIEAVANAEMKDGKLLGDVVKARVENELKDNEAYRVGKAIIAGLKE